MSSTGGTVAYRFRTGKGPVVIAAALAFTATGLMFACLLLGVGHVPGKTLDASLFEVLN